MWDSHDVTPQSMGLVTWGRPEPHKWINCPGGAKRSCPLGHKLISMMPNPLPDTGHTEMLMDGPPAVEEEKNFFLPHPCLVQTLHQAVSSVASSRCYW